MVNIEITNKNIKPFERYARKYGINYALKKDKSKEPPVYLVFFKGRDQDALNAALREFSQKQIQKANKPSIHKRLAAYRAMMPKKTKVSFWLDFSKKNYRITIHSFNHDILKNL